MKSATEHSIVEEARFKAIILTTGFEALKAEMERFERSPML